MAYRNSYTLDGVALTNVAQGYFPEKSTGIRTVPAKRNTGLSYPGVDGEAFQAGAPYQPGGVTVNMYVEGADHQGFMENLEFLNGLFLQRHKLLPLRHDYTPAGSIYRMADVKCISSTDVRRLSISSGMIEYALEIPGAFWRSGSESTTATPVVTTSTQTYTVASLAGGNAPVSDATIRVKGAFSGILIKDVATGSQLELIGAISASEYVIISPAEWFASKVNTDTWNRFSSGWVNYSNNVVSNRGSGSQFIMEPLITAGALGYQITFSGTTLSSSPVIEVRAKKSFL